MPMIVIAILLVCFILSNGVEVNSDETMLALTSGGELEVSEYTEDEEKTSLSATTLSETDLTGNLTINAKDLSGNPIEGAKFEIYNKEDYIEIPDFEVVANGNYYFEEQDGKYVPNNIDITNQTTYAYSYVKIDLTDLDDVYLKVNVTKDDNYSSGSYFYGTITESEDVPSTSSKDYIYLSYSTVGTKNYLTLLEGGKVYYLHFTYYHYGYIDPIRELSINDISLINADTYEENIVTTNEEGIAEVELEYGDYSIEQVEAPSPYTIEDNTINEISVSRDSTELNITSLTEKLIIWIYHYMDSYFWDPYSGTYVPAQDGGYIEEFQYMVVRYGETYETSPAENVDENYEVSYTEGETSGTAYSNMYICYYYRPKTYTLNLNKIDEENNEIKIPNTTFEITTSFYYSTAVPMSYSNTTTTYSQYGKEEVSNSYTTNENGNIYIDELYVGKEYTLEEIMPNSGYVDEEIEVKFIVTIENGEYVIEFTEGSLDNVNIEGSLVNITIENTPSFKLIKENIAGERLAGAKFTIEDEEGYEAVDGSGNPVGEVEEINGVEMRVVTTDENGEISIALPAGKYTLTEVQAPDGYVLPEENSQVIEIEATGKKEIKSVSINMETLNMEYILNGLDGSSFCFNEFYSDKMTPESYMNGIYVSKILPTGEMILTGGLIGDKTTIPGSCTTSGEDIVLTKTSDEDGIFIMTDTEGKIDKVVQITSDTGYNYIEGIYQADDGFILEGYFDENIHISSDNTSTGDEILLESYYDYGITTYFTKINNEGQIDYVTDLSYLYGEIEYLVEAEVVGNNLSLQCIADGEVVIPAENTADKQEIKIELEEPQIIEILIGEDGKVIQVSSSITEEEYTNIWNNIWNCMDEIYNNSYRLSERNVNDEIDSVTYVARYTELLYIPGEYTVSGEDILYYNSSNGYGYALIEINKEGKVNFVCKFISGYTDIYDYKKIDDGYLIAGYIDSSINIPGEDTVTGEDIYLNYYDGCGYIMKVNSSGKVEWATNLWVYGSSSQIEIVEYDDNYYVLEYYTSADYYAIHKINELNETVNTIAEQKVVTIQNTKDPTIDDKVAKTTDTTEITYEGQEVDYRIEYTATITDYEGDATVTIVDKLPYEIDEDASTIPGDYEYDEEKLTITWTEEISGINTYEEAGGTYTIPITKDLILVYKDVDVTKDTVDNEVEVTIELETPEKTSTVKEDEKIPTNYLTEVEVVKVWDDNKNSSHRPSSVTVTLVSENAENLEEIENRTVELNEDNNWSYTYENLPKYTSRGEKIEYTVVETETNEGDLEYYEDADIEEVNGRIKVTNTYQEREAEVEAEVTKTGTNVITSSSDKVTYKITYEATIDNYVGSAKVTIIDYLPYEIDEEASTIPAGYTYDETAKTLTWTEDLGHINTDNEGTKTVKIEKELTLVFKNIDATAESMTNTAEVILTLEETGEEIPEEDSQITTIDIDGNVVVRYLEEGTEKVLADQIEETGKVGTTYETIEKDITGYDLVRVDGDRTVTYIEGTIYVTYYYKLKDPVIDDDITKTSDTITVTSLDQVIDYTIEYEAEITDYKGNTTVTIVDYLPYAIDTEADGTDLDGGDYSEENGVYTITWEIPIDIDTYNGTNNTISITKKISVVYKNIDVTASTIYNKVEGTIKLETPEKESTVYEDETLPVDFTVDIPVEKIWLDNENSKEHRPTTVTVVLTADEVETDNSIVLKATEDWEGIFEDLPKYTDEGVEINYSVVEYETTENDLEYYDEAKIENVDGVITITNRYKNMDTNLDSEITKTGTEEITSSNDLVEYEINYTVEVDEYVGGATVTIVDYLPYALETDEEGNPVEGIDLDGGTYTEENEVYKITWVEPIAHINTYKNEKYTYTFTKSISVLFVDIDTTKDIMTNRVTGAIELDEYKDTDEGLDTDEDTWDTEINVYETVITRYLEEGTGTELEEEKQTDKVGKDYTTEPKDITGYNLVRVEEEDIEGTIIITYYYKLKDPIVEKEITKTTETEEVTEVDQLIDYTIEYTATIDDYMGNATVTIVDYLPYAIDTEAEGTNLDGGTYVENEGVYTITWTENYTDIYTYTGTVKEISITKEISVVYKNIDVTQETIKNEAEGILHLYTPEEDITTERVEKEIPTEFYIDISVEKIWKDSENETHRPTSVLVWLTGNGFKIEGYNVVLDEKNEWSYTFEDIPKYTNSGEEIEWTVVEEEVEEDDLEYYEEPVIEVTKVEDLEEAPEGMEYDDIVISVTNSYKNMESITETELEKTGTETVTTSSQEVEYTIDYEAIIDSYIGGATVTIVDYLPYRLATDEDGNLVEGIDLDGGEYDSDSNTITWVEIIYNINTFTNDKYHISITKNITLIFDSLDATQREMTNEVISNLYLEETDKEVDDEDDYTTELSVLGRVNATYVDIDTGEEIADSEEYSGYVGDEYSTEQKDIEYYDFVEVEGETEGTLTEEDKYVVYYYQKKPFNLAVEKNLSKIVLNGTEQTVTNGKLSKVEVPVSSASTANLEVTYTIVISNTGEIPGTADVVETLPDYFTLTSGTSSEWEEQSDGTLKATVELDAGETKELTVVLKWTAGSSNFGTLTNTVSLENVDNSAGFNEETVDDNTSEADLILSVKTGLDKGMTAIGLIIAILLITAGGIILSKKTLKK